MRHSLRRSRGLTLVEAAIVVALVAVIAGIALPEFRQLRARHQLDGAAAQLETDLMLARSEAVARAGSVRVEFSSDAGGSCYVMHDGATGDCRCASDALPVCVAGANTLRSASFPLGGPVQVASRSSSIVFDAVLGTVTPTATIRVVGGIGSVHQVVNIMGRVRSCVPAPGRSGYPTC
jgi:type IV fimbrial biogenesis protein FimT